MLRFPALARFVVTDCQAGGRKFKSRHSRHSKINGLREIANPFIASKNILSNLLAKFQGSSWYKRPFLIILISFSVNVMWKRKKAESIKTLPFPVRLSHFHGVARSCSVYWYVLATFVIHTKGDNLSAFNRTIIMVSPQNAVVFSSTHLLIDYIWRWPAEKMHAHPRKHIKCYLKLSF